MWNTLLETGGKVIFITKWQRTWLVMFAFCYFGGSGTCKWWNWILTWRDFHAKCWRCSMALECYSKMQEERDDLKMEFLSKVKEELKDLENSQYLFFEKGESTFRRGYKGVVRLCLIWLVYMWTIDSISHTNRQLTVWNVLEDKTEWKKTFRHLGCYWKRSCCC